MKRLLCVIALGVCLVYTCHDARAQVQTPKKKVTQENVTKVPLGGFGGGTPKWLDDEHFVETKGGKQMKVAAVTGKAEPYTPPEAPARPALSGSEVTTLSPDGKRAAFVRGGNLFVYDQAAKTERQLTRDGGDKITNGKADWVYYEELFHRNYRALWWSPDSAHVAFLNLDDRKVAPYTLITPTTPVQAPEIATYPKTGKTNPSVKLGIAVGGTDLIAWVDLSEFGPADELLISRVGWLPDSKQAYFYVQDRAQTWLDVCTVGHEGGKPRKLFRDTTKAWIEDLGPLTFLKDGSFLVTSERSGFKHLYHYHPDGKLRQAVTQGEWDLRTLHHVDEGEGWVYFSGTRDSWLGSNLYRVRLDGRDLARLTRQAGTHTTSLSPGAQYFTDTWSSYDMPPQVALYRNDGTLVRVVRPSPGNKIKEQYELGKDELMQIPMPDGFVLPARVVLPPDYDANKRYPVWFMTYAGPHAPTLRDQWSGGGMRDQMLATMGFVVFRFDPRSASNMGAASAWTAYRQLGVQELKDIEAAITWLCKSYPAVDPKRIGMSGHSYGGFMTAYALTHSKLFAAGIAGSPVTRWENYDTIYTERYMSTPKDNPKGYEASSVVKAAKNLHGKLLIAHGMMDDNVHVQNAMELIHALQQADRDFEVMIYPHARHGLFGNHYQRLQIDFMKRVLQP
jgi:dipeptidyl-peptidase-4